MSCTSDFSPIFQAQNPAISGYKYGWESCAAFVGAMAHDYATCGSPHVTGATVRNNTNEAIPNPGSPGLTVVQIRDSLKRLGVPVTVFLKMPWAQVEYLVNTGHYVGLAIAYSVIRATRYSGDPNFYGGHAIGVPPGWEVQDPLCDGRRAGIYKYHHEAYPVALVKAAAGAFRIVINGVAQPLGFGYAQGYYTAAHPAPLTKTLHIAAGTKQIQIASVTADVPPKIAAWRTAPWSGDASSAPCLPIQTLVLTGTAGTGTADVARVVAGAFASNYVRIGAAYGTSVT